MYPNMRKEAKEMANSIRKDIGESKHGLLKLVGIEIIPLAMGATLGGIGRATGEHWVPAVPICMDLMMHVTGYTSARGLWGLAKYGIGVALPYADKVYLAAQMLSDIV